MAEANEFTQEKIAHLARAINSRLSESIAAIEDVNDDIHVLSVNAKIQAARAGAAGAGFGVVADEVRNLVNRTQGITSNLQLNVSETVRELMQINDILGTRVRGERLSQVSGTAIDIVDRNLYERSCDVRWWATEDAVVEVACSPNPEKVARACKRLGVILDSYTVYTDLVLCDLDGRVVANGRPNRFSSIGSSVLGSRWFDEAVRSLSGSEFGFEGVHRNKLVRDSWSLVYSCGVREEGRADGKLVGVLGIIFNWEELGRVVTARSEEMLSAETGHKVRSYIIDAEGVVIGSSDNAEILSPLKIDRVKEIVDRRRGHLEGRSPDGREHLVGFAFSPGYETYRSNWYSVSAESRD